MSVPELQRIARDGNYGLIVMGTRKRHGLSHLVLGSVSEKVVRLASCPVLILPPTNADHSRAA